jgi:hypothetical protein
MAQIKQVGVGRKSIGTIDGITYYVRGGKTFARSTPTIPASVYNTPEAKLRQAIFKMVQMHMKLHLRTLRQTITPKSGGSASNRYYSLNSKALTAALHDLAEQYVDGMDVTITEIEAAIAEYAAEHPTSIKIASKSGYQEVYLTGEWPSTITLNASAGDSTMIIIVAENGTTTTYNANGTVVVSGGSSSGSNSGSTDLGNNGSTGGNSGNSGSVTQTVTAPSFSGETQFTDSTQVTISCPDGATIHYTVDGSTPTAESTQYSEPLTFTETTTLKAIAIKDGVSSAVTSRTYTKGSSGGAGGQD